MASKSKEDMLLQPILGNSPLKHWHFEALVRKTGMTRAAVNKWLKRYQKVGLIKRIKKKGSFPYYTCGADNPNYIAKKKIYALQQLYDSGLISELLSQKNVKTIIIFGSIPRGDWYDNSDIDIFIFGKPGRMNRILYEKKLRRTIDLHIFESEKDIQDVRTGLMKNVANGYVIKGSILDIVKVSV